MNLYQEVEIYSQAFIISQLGIAEHLATTRLLIVWKTEAFLSLTILILIQHSMSFGLLHVAGLLYLLCFICPQSTSKTLFSFPLFGMSIPISPLLLPLFSPHDRMQEQTCRNTCFPRSMHRYSTKPCPFALPHS